MLVAIQVLLMLGAAVGVYIPERRHEAPTPNYDQEYPDYEEPVEEILGSFTFSYIDALTCIPI